MNDTDFVRPKGKESGVLLNTNNEALQSYKKAKGRMNKLERLEEEITELKQQINLLLVKIG